MTPAQLLTAARVCGNQSAVAAVDVVEVDATTDVAGATVLVAAQVVLHFASGVLQRREDA